MKRVGNVYPGIVWVHTDMIIKKRQNGGAWKQIYYMNQKFARFSSKR